MAIPSMTSIRIAPAFLFFLLLTTAAFAQRYKTAVGVRIDGGLNLTAQQYITNGWTAEGIVHTGINSDRFGVTLLGEKHHKILFRGINFYVGAGLHYYGINGSDVEGNASANQVFGLTAIGGAELSIGRLNFAVDWKPELHLAGDQVHPFNWNGASISVRYIIAKRERKQVKDWGVWDKLGSKNKNKSKKKK
ncbi:MAG: hypothetical protein ABIQ93_14520 [Saprospiraceae bacterium]